MINAAANRLAGKAASCQPAEITEDGAGRPVGSGAPREGRRTAGPRASRTLRGSCRGGSWPLRGRA